MEAGHFLVNHLTSAVTLEVEELMETTRIVGIDYETTWTVYTIGARRCRVFVVV